MTDECRGVGCDVDFWDLDHTILNTERQLFAPVLERVVSFAGRSLSEVRRTFAAANNVGFSWRTWFGALGLDPDTSAMLQRWAEEHVAANIGHCYYPGVLDLIERRRTRGVAQVLITAGDPAWQRWKFMQAKSLHGLFVEAHRHFVTVSGPKGRPVASYTAGLRKAFIDDSARWHGDVMAWRIPGLRHIRPQWPDTEGVCAEMGDGTRWTVVRTIDELTSALEAV